MWYTLLYLTSVFYNKNHYLNWLSTWLCKFIVMNVASIDTIFTCINWFTWAWWWFLFDALLLIQHDDACRMTQRVICWCDKVFCESDSHWKKKKKQTKIFDELRRERRRRSKTKTTCAGEWVNKCARLQMARSNGMMANLYHRRN